MFDFILYLIVDHVKLVLFIIAITLLLYQTVVKNYTFFDDRSLKYIRGLPFMGVQAQLVGKHTITEVLLRWYRTYPEEKVIGIYEFNNTPVFQVRDPELIKLIMIKDFDYFVNHRFNIDDNVDILFSRAVFFMKDKQWKMMRSVLSPGFTGSKMRLMFGIMNEYNEKFVKYLKNEHGNKAIDLEMKDLFTRYATDIIATCAFGIEVNSHKDRDNQFFKFGNIFANFSGLQAFKFFIVFACPIVAKVLRLSIAGKKFTEFFKQLVSDSIKYRKENNIVRHDVINLLMEAKDDMLKEGSENHNEKLSGKPNFIIYY